MSEAVYDTGALTAAERNNRTFWADHRMRLEQGTIPITPAPVVAQVSRSPRQAQLRRLLRGCDVTEPAEDTAHRIGRILAHARTADTANAFLDSLRSGTVVVEGIGRHAQVVTSDRDDITHLLQA
ncbi:MAG: twitching motility protein PilT, partial [Egibacteraceae bacterium]